MDQEMAVMAQKIEELEDTIETLHHMANNNAKQAADEIRHKISAGIKLAVDDLNSGIAAEMDDATKVEFYRSVLDDMFYVLKSVGVTVEVTI